MQLLMLLVLPVLLVLLMLFARFILSLSAALDSPWSMDLGPSDEHVCAWLTTAPRRALP